MVNPFKQPALAKVYDVMLTLARDKSSELYLRDGGQHRGASHRCAFWDAFNGRAPSLVPKGTIVWACHRAGLAYRKEVK